MKRLFKCIAGLLVLSVMGLYCPGVSVWAGSGLLAKADKKQITRHEPRVMAEPEKDIPVAVAGPGERKKTPWLMIGLGAVAVAVLAAIAGGGGGGGGGGGNGPEEPEEPEDGTITVNW
jgi:hypothetical protein